MNANMTPILDKIKAYSNIIIFRHKRPDGDCTGATKGLQQILRLTYPEKSVHLSNTDFCEYVSFLGEENSPLPDAAFADALGIVIDTATADRISDQRFSLCRELIKIDHHINVDPYAPLEWVEEERSSACEMIAAFYDAFRDELKMDEIAATCIYTGMVTDSGRFRFRSVSGDTMRLAGMLLDCGIDTDLLYANLYMKDFNALQFQAYMLGRIKRTEHGVAYLHVTRAMQEKFALSFEQACASVSYMDAIRGSLIWIAFIDCEDSSIRVRLRSRFVTVNEIASKYHGGGHACASGATVANRAEMRRLLADADARLGAFKQETEGWL